MIVCPQPQAAEKGIQILRRGGNAVDAAVATAFLQGVVDIQNCGIGGFGQMHVYMADTGEESILDFHGRAGSKVTPEMWKNVILNQSREGFGYALKGDVNRLGYRSIVTPGTVMGLYEGHTRYGTLSWKDLLQPSIDLADKGFTVTQEQARDWRIQAESFAPFLVTDEGKRIYTKDGEPHRAGDVLANKDYAETLRRIASDGADIFYRGEIADKMLEDLERNGAFIVREDLEKYKVKVYSPITTEYRGFTVASNDAPGGGLTLLELLNIVEGYDLAKHNWRGMGFDVAEYIHLLAMAMRAAESDRAEYVGDPDFVDVPTEMIISKVRAEEWRQRIDSNEKILVPKWPQEPPSTTHLCVVDEKGNAVSLTHTLGSCSGVITPGLGFLYNNAMINFDPVPGRTNSIAPGKSRITQMSPTMILKEGEPYMIIGAPGGGHIVSALLQVITNIIDHEMTPMEAVAHPRVFCLDTEIIDVGARIPQYVCDELSTKRNKIMKMPISYEPFASVQTILIDKARDRALGGSDPRTGGIFLST